LECASNFVSWKCILQNLLDVANLWYLVEKEVNPPTDPRDLTEYNKNAMNAKQVIQDLVKDHLIPCIIDKSTTKEIYDALGTLYQSVNVSRKML